MTRTIIFLNLYFLSISILKAQSYFSKSFIPEMDNHGNNAYSLQKYEDGYLILMARVDDSGVGYANTTKVNAAANFEWSENYYLENQEKPPFPGLTFVQDESNIYIGCQYYNSETKLDLELLCIDRLTKDTLWTKKYPAPSNDYILYTLKTIDSAIVLVSATTISNNVSKLRVTKIDKSGNILWDKFFNTYKKYYPWQACTANDGSLLIAYAATKQGLPRDIGVISKINLSGEIVWTKEFNQSNSLLTVSTVTQLKNGDIAFGWTRDTNTVLGSLYEYPPSISILDSLGNLKYNYTFYHPELKSLATLRTLPNGDLLGIGLAESEDSVNFIMGGWLFRMSPTGEVIWERLIADIGFNEGGFYDAIATDDNSILALGWIFTKDSVPEQLRVWTVKIGEDGCYGPICDQTEILLTPSSEAPLPDKNRYRIVPNPADQYLRIEGLTGIEERRLEIYSTSGRLVRQTEYPQPGDIQVNDLPPGIYTLKITLKNNYFATLQFIKS